MPAEMSIWRRRVDAGAELTRCAGFDLIRVRPMNALVESVRSFVCEAYHVV